MGVLEIDAVTCSLQDPCQNSALGGTAELSPVLSFQSASWPHVSLKQRMISRGGPHFTSGGGASLTEAAWAFCLKDAIKHSAPGTGTQGSQESRQTSPYLYMPILSGCAPHLGLRLLLTCQASSCCERFSFC